MRRQARPRTDGPRAGPGYAGEPVEVAEIVRPETVTPETVKLRASGRGRARTGKRHPPLPGGDDPAGLVALMDRYLESLRTRNYAAGTIESRRLALYTFVEWCHERSLTRPGEVSKPVLERYQRHLYTYRKGDGAPLAFATQAGILSRLCGFFGWLTRQNHIAGDPSSGIDLPRPEYRLPTAVLSADEVEAVLALPDTGTLIGLRDRVILEVLYATAVRRTELCVLRLDDIDWSRCLLRITQGKGHKDRVVPMGERARAWLEVYRQHVRPQLVCGADDGWLFLNRDGGPLNIKKLSGRVGGYVARANIGKAGACHLFRHTAATLMLEGGADIRYIQAFLGHENLESTQVYTRVSVAQLQAIHARTHPGATSLRTPGDGLPPPDLQGLDLILSDDDDDDRDD
ncbi:site-specific tyrosine recombinase XerC [Asticcacaulis sp. W401b]|uniref:site-specific tyrosine recombinase XerC n=1 Tax=Asticcacaulis sp. W401b TaxID=3388666 RepID=UPI0039706DB8